MKAMKITLQKFAVATVLLSTTGLYAQTGIGTLTPDPSSVVDITSTTKGLLIPRMSTTERNNIVSPAVGLLVFDTTTNTLYVNDGGWQESAFSSNNKFVDGTTPADAVYTATGNVGIGTAAPKATLDVVGQPAVTTSLDGVIPPRLTRAQLAAKTGYGADQVGAIVYVTDVSAGAVSGLTRNVTDIGMYRLQPAPNSTFAWVPVDKWVSRLGQSRIDFRTTSGGDARNNTFGSRDVVILDDGRVGIGTVAPASRLHANGEITIGSDNRNGVPGMIRYDAATGKFQGYGDSSPAAGIQLGWVDLN